ncbi:MAG: PhoPQ-activated pathogenicity-related family protein [Bacteroidota bacterium]
MFRQFFSIPGIFFLSLILLSSSCRTPPVQKEEHIDTRTLFEAHFDQVDPAFEYELVSTIPGEGHTTYVIRMVSQSWLTTEQVKDPVWWHWLTVVVPDQLTSDIGLLFIGGGSRKSEQPSEADPMMLQTALASQSVAVSLHNVPNQPLEFVGDDYGPRVEDELIAYGWRKFMEGGAKGTDAIWLARFPMTTAAVRAMDVITAFSKDQLSQPVEQFVVAGGSKRGWTTWTTAIVDQRVIAIAPIVIDMLNVVPSFQHHWRAYGHWAPAVGNYDSEGIMDWQGSREYQAIMDLVEPYSYREKLALPKLLINAAGDQFFLTDSWQFYWDDLVGEKHLRYVANGDHSLAGTDAITSLISFHQHIVNQQARPDLDWKVVDGKISIQTQKEFPPIAIHLWQATNPEGRDFRVETIGRAWSSDEIQVQENGSYQLHVSAPDQGYTAFFVELTFAGIGGVPMKVSTGTVVTPDTYPFEAFQSENPHGTK